MRAEAERVYQTGGLAAVAVEEEETSTPAITVDQIVSRTTGSDVTPSLTSMIIGNKEQALARLRAGREDIASRRASRAKSQERDKWLALAQGMLAPTRTGGFGESLGQTAGLLREESARRIESEVGFDEELDVLAAQEIAAEAQAVDQMLKLSGQGASGKGIHGAIQTMIHEDDRDKAIIDQRLVFGSLQQKEDGTWQLRALADENGDFFLAADRLDPARAAALVVATERAESQTQTSEAMIAKAYGYISIVSNIRRANDLFEGLDPELSTSGVTVIRNRVANIFGIDLGDTTELTELQMLIADHYLSRLEALKGNTSDRDIQEMKGISVGLGQNTTANYRILRRMEAVYSTAIRRGIREAYQSGDMDAVGDLWAAAENAEWDSDMVFIKTEDDYNNLAPGTSFYMEGEWGGEHYTKPALDEEGNNSDE